MKNKGVKIFSYALYLLAGMAVVVTLTVLFMSQYQVEAQMGQDQMEGVSRDRFMQVQGSRFDMMVNNGMNPGELMGRGSMSRQDFINLQGDLYGVMEEYDIHPATIMGGCPVLMGGMMLSPWCTSSQMESSSLEREMGEQSATSSSQEEVETRLRQQEQLREMIEQNIMEAEQANK